MANRKAINIVESCADVCEDGYPRFAEFIGDKERTMMFRRFRHFSARLILEKQDDIRIIETELRELDEADSSPTPDGKPSRKWKTRHRQDRREAEKRRKLFARAEKAYKEYADLLAAAQQLATLGAPRKYDSENVFKFVKEANPVVRRVSLRNPEILPGAYPR